MAALLRLLSFSTRPLVMLHVLPERGVKSFGKGNELGWHSSINIAKSGVLLAIHCNLINACRCLLRMLCDENDCASRESEGRGEEVTLRFVMLRSYRVGSKSSE